MTVPRETRKDEQTRSGVKILHTNTPYDPGEWEPNAFFIKTKRQDTACNEQSRNQTPKVNQM